MLTVKIAMIGAVMTLGASMTTALDLHVGMDQTYSTITDAFAATRATTQSDTIIIHEGVYTEFPDLWANNTRKNKTFQRFGEDKVVVKLSTAIRHRSDGMDFIGIIFDATDIDYVYSSAAKASHIVFRDCIFIGATSGAILLNATSNNGPMDDIVIENCTFINCVTGFRPRGVVTNSRVSNCIFVDHTTAALNPDSGVEMTVEYTAFWNNTIVWDGGTLGAGCLTDVQPRFSPSGIADDYFMYLSSSCPVSITTGSSTGSFMGTPDGSDSRDCAIYSVTNTSLTIERAERRRLVKG